MVNMVVFCACLICVKRKKTTKHLTKKGPSFNPLTLGFSRLPVTSRGTPFIFLTEATLKFFKANVWILYIIGAIVIAQEKQIWAFGCLDGLGWEVWMDSLECFFCMFCFFGGRRKDEVKLATKDSGWNSLAFKALGPIYTPLLRLKAIQTPQICTPRQLVFDVAMSCQMCCGGTGLLQSYLWMLGTFVGGFHG